MILSFDTTKSDGIELWLLDDHDAVIDSRRFDLSSGSRAQVVLTEIDQLLSQRHISPTSVTAIRVALGPGSFTGTRVGVAVANSLGLALAVPINGLPVGSFVQPVYNAAPNIATRQS